MSYHKKVIEKGELRELSKIREEFEELVDAEEQKDAILQICELSDLVGAIEEYSLKYFDITLEDLIKFSDKTKEAFKEGKR